MMASHIKPERRTIRTTNAVELGRLEAAWSELEHALAHGDTASQLDVEDLDHIICDLIAIRHRKLSGGDSQRDRTTVVTEGCDDTVVLESHFGDDLGNDSSLSESP